MKPRRRIEIPEETRRLAVKLYERKPTVAYKMAVELGGVFEDADFENLYSNLGQSSASPAILATILVLQSTEGLTDRQAEEATRSRVDWKFALRLSLDHPGVEHTVISEFRTRLLEGGAELLLLDKLLNELKKRGLIKDKGRQRTDSTIVISVARELNRLERIGEAMRNALNGLFDEAPEFLRTVFKGEWHERYGRPFFNMRLPKDSKGRDKLAETIGKDGLELLNAIDNNKSSAVLNTIAEVDVLRKIWEQEFIAPPNEPPRFLKPEEMKPAAERIATPYDRDARWSTKRSESWTGYKAHYTETCDEGMPQLITNVETTVATVPDQNMLSLIHESLKKRMLLPNEHLVDRGYTNAESLVSSEKLYQVKVVGEITEDHSWQAELKHGFDKASFTIDWENKTAQCPAGKSSMNWDTRENGSHHIRFSQKDCGKCSFRESCTSKAKSGRQLNLLPQEHEQALQAARARQETEEFKKTYAQRAGVEGLISQVVMRCGLRRSPYVGLAKTGLHHILIAVAINVTKFTEWCAGTRRAKTRKPRFAALQAA